MSKNTARNNARCVLSWVQQLYKPTQTINHKKVFKKEYNNNTNSNSNNSYNKK